MNNKYKNLCDDISKQMRGKLEITYTTDDIKKISGTELPKSYQNRNYLNGSNSPIGRYLNENDLVAEYMPAQLIVKHKKEKI